MGKQIIFFSFFFLIIADLSFSQKAETGSPGQQDSNINQLTPKELAALNAITKNHKSGTINWQTIKKEIQGRPELSSLPIQLAMNTVMMKIEQDAEKNLQQRTAEVRSANEKKDSIKKKSSLVKKDHVDLQDKLRKEYDSLRLASVSSNRAKTNNPFLQQEKSSEAEAENAAKRKKNAEDHLRSVKEAIKKNQQLQSQY